MKRFILLVVLGIFFSGLNAQLKKLVVIGSSTAFGTGAQPANDSSWVRRINYHYKYQQSVVDTVYNLALGGYDPYHGLPSGYTPAQFYSLPDPARNITKANSLGPNVIIVSFVSNNFQVGGLPIDSIMKALQLIKDSANREGRVCFITTSQPRTQFDIPSRERLKIIKDSILNRFGFYSINFYDSIVNPIDNSILTEYASPFDMVHLNNAGHNMLYRQVLGKDIFNTTINRTRMSGDWNNPFTWDKGIVPSVEDSIAILPGHNLIINSSAQVRGLSVAPGGTLSLNNASVQLQVGETSQSNHNVTINGTLSIINGKLIVYGYLKQSASSSFSMSNGELIIDGNNGTAISSVQNNTHLFEIDASSNFSFTGGTLQFIDPPLGNNSQAISCPFNFGSNSIVKMGNGSSATASNNENGFGGNLLPAQIGRLIIDASTISGNRIFKNLNPLTAKKGIEVLSGNLVQSALLNVENN
ncbi:MAG: hypothetical protein ACKVOW_05960 [Chitinophagaceae bacterium]